MDWLIAHGHLFIQAVQAFRNPVLDGIFLFFTFVGSETFLLLLVPLLFWAFNRRWGVYVALLFILSGLLNTGLKALLHQPRPSPNLVTQVVLAEGYGLPSGHAQNAVVVWGWLAHATGRRVAWWGAVALSVLIGFSRVYLGVHFPHDVLAGWGIGLVLLWAVVRWGDEVEQRLIQQPFQVQFALAVLPLLSVAVMADELVARATGALVGAAVGVLCERRWVRFSPGDSFFRRLTCLVVGFVGLGLVWGGGKLLIPPTPLGLLVRYALAGGWITWGAPFLFVRAGLAQAETQGGGG